MAAAIDRVVNDPQLRADAGRGGRRTGRVVRPAPGPGRVRLGPRGRLRGVTRPGRPPRSMKVAFVVPRYGPAIIGGAETAARHVRRAPGGQTGLGGRGPHQLCRGLRDLGRRLPGGRGAIDGVRCAGSRRRPGAIRRSIRCRPPCSPTRTGASPADAERWLDLQGPVTPGAGRGRRRVRRRRAGLLPLPLLPDGPGHRAGAGPDRAPPGRPRRARPAPARSSRRVFEAADGLVFQTAAERQLVQRIFPVATHHQLLLGLGVDDPRPTSGGLDGARRRAVRPARTSSASAGSTGTRARSLLAAMFAAYKARHPGPLRLVFAGPVVEAPDRPPRHRRARARCRRPTSGTCSPAPSPWCRRRGGRRSRWWWRRHGAPGPRCWSTRLWGHRRALPPVGRGAAPSTGSASSRWPWSGWSATPALARTLGQRGRAYVDGRFRWPVVIDRYATFLESVVAAGGRSVTA